MPPMPALAASVAPIRVGDWGTSSAKWVGRAHRLAARRPKASMLLRTKELRRTRLAPAWFWAHWRALKSPLDPGMARDTKRSFPRMLRHRLMLMRRRPWRSPKMSQRACFRWGGSSMVCRAVSMIHPRMSFLVPQLPSPVRSFFRDTASFRPREWRGRRRCCGAGVAAELGGSGGCPGPAA
jgi:hypothetical protein